MIGEGRVGLERGGSDVSGEGRMGEGWVGW